MADDEKGQGETPGAPPTGANPAATPQHRQVPGGDAPATAAAAAATGAAPRPAAAPRPPAPVPDLAGRTTTVVASRAAAPAAAAEPDDSSPLISRRAWIGLAWGAFSAASVAALAATGRFMFPNVLNEPPQQFRAGLPTEYGVGVDERWKERYGIWLVRTADDVDTGESGFFALIAVCTHLGCTPNYLAAEAKFKCPCHGSGFRISGLNFEGPAPRPLERARIVLADDGQILVDRSRKFQRELGQWTDGEAFLRV